MKTIFGTFAMYGFTREERSIAVFKRKTQNESAVREQHAGMGQQQIRE
jgi:hypothetical protein